MANNAARTGPDWLIRPGKDNYEIWLCGGCIDSIEKMNEAEEFLRCMRPLMQAKEDQRIAEAAAIRSVPASLEE